MSVLSILKQIATTGSNNAKLDILKTNKDNETLKNVFRLAYNKRIVFGIKKIPPRQIFRGIINFDIALEELETVFATRQLTGNAAFNRLQEIMGMMSEDNAEVIKRILLRDLECGASDSSACKVWGKDLIPSQPCMKASAYSDKTISNIKFPAIAQLKADGTRCMVVKQNGIVTAWSRNGKEYKDLPIFKIIEDCLEDNFVLDGELVYKPTTCVDVADRQTGNGVVSKAIKGTITPEEANDICFQVWDYIPVDDYWSGEYKIGYDVRMKVAIKTVDSLNDSRIEFIETCVVNTLQEARDVYVKYVETGLEGIILKNIKGYWKDTRSKDQVKFKEVISVDMIVVGHYVHAKDHNKIGGLTVESKCGQIRCNVGSGFTDTDYKKINEIDETGESIWEYIPLDQRKMSDREYIMANIDDYIWKVVELECNGCIARKNPKPDEAPYKLFLPVFCHVRFDKNQNDANTKEEVFG